MTDRTFVVTLHLKLTDEEELRGRAECEYDISDAATMEIPDLVQCVVDVTLFPNLQFDKIPLTLAEDTTVVEQ